MAGSRPPNTCWSWLIWAGLFLILMPASHAQKLPVQKENIKKLYHDHPEVFHDTKVLPDGMQVTIFLYKNKPKRYFFIMEEDGNPFSLSVTPCASALQWNVTFTYLPDESRKSKKLRREEATPRRRKSGGRGVIKVQELAWFEGDQPETYTTESSTSGAYSVVLRALDHDSTVKLYATRTPNIDQAFPELPDDPSVHVMSTDKEGIHFAWKPSPSDVRDEKRIEYCISVNNKQNFHSRCAALENKYGDIAPTLPPHTGFGFKERKQERHPLQAMSNLLYKCVGTKTHYMFSDTRWGETYYIDVFAVDKSNNRSIAYNGTSEKYNWKRKEVALKEGKVVVTYMKPSASVKLFRYVLRNDTKELTFTLQLCYGDAKVAIYKSGKLLKRARARNMRNIVLRHPTRGVYSVKVIAAKRKSTSFRISVSTNSHKYPYPTLPKDTRIKVFKNLSTCNSVTVAWLGTSKRQRYCLYKRPRGDRGLPSSFQNRCPTRRKTGKVSCRFFRARNKRKAVMTETIRGLSPDTEYVLDVFVRKSRGELLSYQPVLARTSRC